MSDVDQSTMPTGQPDRKRGGAGRWILLMVCLLVVVGLALPITNLFMTPPTGTALTQVTQQHPEFAAAAKILESNCLDCHSADAKLPFYANFPVAHTLVQADMDRGQRYIDMEADLTPKANEVYNQASLEKLEYVLSRNMMPPTRYAIVHWDRILSAQEKQTLLDAIRQIRAAHFVTAGVTEAHEYDALQPLPESVAVDAEKVALGEKMYHDVRLSGDNTLSCASCHALDKGGTDQEVVSTGIGGAKGPINAPTVYNSVFFLAQFWDGRAVDLKDQAAGPVHNPIEMGSNWEQVLEKLKVDDEVVNAFAAVYDDGLTGDNIADAIAEFEKSLITPNSSFDRYLKGEAEALGKAELVGLKLFRDNACSNCHVGMALGGQSYELMGRAQAYFTADSDGVDLGRFNATEQARDKHKFKTPTLRNVEVTYPYFHDGSQDTLKGAVMVMAKCNGYHPFSDLEAEQVVSFLKTLTGEYNGQRLQ